MVIPLPLLRDPLSKAQAASGIRTPLAEFAVRTAMLLILALFETADEPVRGHLKTDPLLVDKLLLPPGRSHIFHHS
jgi:hypothetical protein